MFYVNGVRLNLESINYDFLTKEEEHELKSISLKVKRELENIKKEPRVVKFRVKDNKIVNETGELEPPKSVTLPLKTTYRGEWGDEEWIFSKAILAKSNGNLDLPSAQYSYMIFNELTLDPRTDFEFIYFLRYISPTVKSGAIYEYNEENESTVFFEREGREAELKIAIKNIVEKATLDKLARAWGVAKPDIYEINTVRKKLYNQVLTYENKRETFRRGIAEFLSDISYNSESLQIRELIQKAYEQNTIVMDIDGSFYFGDKFGTKKDLIFKALPSEKQKGLDALYDFLVENSSYLNTLKRMMGIETKEYTEEEIKAMSWNELRRKCPYYEKGMKQDEVIEKWVSTL